RREVLNLMREGRSDAQIKQFLVERYGEFVLYRPRMEGSTLLLWLGPGVLLLAEWTGRRSEQLADVRRSAGGVVPVTDQGVVGHAGGVGQGVGVAEAGGELGQLVRLPRLRCDGLDLTEAVGQEIGLAT
ncbi:MAG: cytochrome c-type biogenesis protein CcmH, partial [Actinobacteria bacterium]|nr:cytochrome c-type biogenesis protein CcmH [Actinomycetota bacterium]